MLRKTVFAALAIGVSAAVAPAPATAACSTGSFQVCASITASYGSNGHLYIRAWNLFGSGGISHVMTFVGIGSSTWSGTSSFVAARFNGNLVSTWKNANTLPNNPVGAELDLAGQTKNGVNYGLVGCGQTPTGTQYQTGCGGTPYLELEFTTSSQIDLATAIYGWHSQDVNGTDCSVWVDSNGRTVGGTVGACNNVVPEPISMVLLGTGLAGVGGIGAIRRRKKDDEIA